MLRPRCPLLIRRLHNVQRPAFITPAALQPAALQNDHKKVSRLLAPVSLCTTSPLRQRLSANSAKLLQTIACPACCGLQQAERYEVLLGHTASQQVPCQSSGGNVTVLDEIEQSHETTDHGNHALETQHASFPNTHPGPLSQPHTLAAFPPPSPPVPSLPLSNIEVSVPPLAQQTVHSTHDVKAVQGSHASTASRRGSVVGQYSHRVILSYDGTSYKGWQLQSGEQTIQGAVENAIATVLREPRQRLNVSAAGRTDAGVHAWGQVVQFYTDKLPDTGKFVWSVNALLPPDIRVLKAARTAPDFHASISATGKIYQYMIQAGAAQDPFHYRQRYHFRRPLNVDAMREAAQVFVGKHDFTQFCNHSIDTARRDPIKNMLRVDVSQLEDGQVIKLEFEGDGFLYKQVRHMSGAILAAGSGRTSINRIKECLAMGASMPPGQSGVDRGWDVAPAKGLFLRQVLYPDGVDNPSHLLHPALMHDEHNRILIKAAE